MIAILLIAHGLIGVALLGAVTHQFAAVMRTSKARTAGFLTRYSTVNSRAFTGTIVGLYLLNFVGGALLYPRYRLDVRIPFEEMGLRWAVGIFELKEHFSGFGAGLLPLYVQAWQGDGDKARLRKSCTVLLASVVWWDFLVGHVLNNIRGLM